MKPSFMEKQNIVLIGQSGMMGGLVSNLILNKNEWNLISIQRKINSSLPIEVIQKELNNLDEIKLEADHILICIGTTIKKAGTLKKFESIDKDLVFKIAKWAIRNNIPHIHIISSIGADIQSSNYYLKTKGEMEHEVSKLPFKSISFYQPSLLLPYNRKEFRWNEYLPLPFIWILKFIGPMKKYQPVSPIRFANFIVKDLQNTKPGIQRYTSEVLNIKLNK